MNQHRYLPMTEEDKQEMLATIGVASIEELLTDIPEKTRFNRTLAIEEALKEPELVSFFEGLAKENRSIKDYPSYLGAGVYEHYIPSIVDHVISRSEFYTAYTPYQPEISQGELQAIFEFQTMICELTGMDLANSSMYDGQTSLAEAAMLAAGHTKKKTILVSKAVHPEARAVLQTNAYGQHLEVIEIETKDGVTDLEQLRAHYSDEVACVIVQHPNFFGSLEPLAEIEQVTHSEKAQFIVSSNPLALGLLKPPGAFGADIVVGDAQPFGIPTQFGGPHCGYFAATKKLMRKVPGRLVGQTVDDQGQRGFVLTLQAREQHIRRDKATSNICSNQALNALAASVAMTAIGKQGIKEMATQNVQKANYLKNQLKKAGVTLLYHGATFNEFVVDLGKPVSEINKQLFDKGIIGGYDLAEMDSSRAGQMLLCVTELRTKQELDEFAKELGAIL
ncbi:glycine dehydrogenase [Bacillus sp. JCM 19045]|uniref:Probable glycine dehydrogenase (decarboxylating) subunit 1 n=1 Tax=Shouchella xiaoxiensis TaxID=766895 RepID=A0ABS2T1H6_9BACI|nr:aminomethyl-transferring glycine dehydrogenase subunit GcvPA [Shouchella xiaoxiensis]MBM7840327.1 glycine dehydrogenase subunit 1 [Shouchella xiaoxiensis]GAF13646.1 glycine dehydrogenase [Bacillus sp. JCM 19045]